jgi:hypothetical protein
VTPIEEQPAAKESNPHLWCWALSPDKRHCLGRMGHVGMHAAYNAGPIPFEIWPKEGDA